MNPYVFSSIPPPSYPGYQPYIGTTTAPHPNSVMNLYSATTAPTPYLMPQNCKFVRHEKKDNEIENRGVNALFII